MFVAAVITRFASFITIFIVVSEVHSNKLGMDSCALPLFAASAALSWTVANMLEGEDASRK